MESILENGQDWMRKKRFFSYLVKALPKEEASFGAFGLKSYNFPIFTMTP